MTLVMAYVILVSAVVAAAAALVDVVARWRRVPTRGLWATALGVVVGVTAFVAFAPRPAQPAVGITPTVVAPAAAAVMQADEAGARSWLRTSDRILAISWSGASLLLLAAIALGRARVTREKHKATRGELHGHAVLLTHDLGPAVAGIREPVVFLPAWVSALDEESQRLLLAHEVEHARRGDTRLLMGGAVLIAVLPWNPVVWWLARRLAIAVEMDCDARVLARHPGVRRYADLLLVAAGTPRFTTRMLAAYFGERSSDLERRIEAMTNPSFKWRPTAGAALVAAVLLTVSCEAPRPEPLAPSAMKAPIQVSPEQDVREFLAEKPATMAEGSVFPKYPDILRQAGVEGEVLVSFVVDATGAADVNTMEVIKSTHELFSLAVKQALPAMRFVPAVAGGKPVAQAVQQPFTFSLPGSQTIQNQRKPLTVDEVVKVPSAGPTGEIEVPLDKKIAFTVKRSDLPAVRSDASPDTSSEKRLAFKVTRGDEPASEPAIAVRGPWSPTLGQSPLMIVDGVVVTTGVSDIDPKSIASIEVLKGSAAVATYGARAQHGVIQIRTKSGSKRIP